MHAGQYAKPLLLTAALAVAVAAAWHFSRPSMRGASSGASSSVEERIDRLLAAQEAQDRRLSSIETLLLSRATGTAAAGHAAATESAPHQEAGEFDQQQQRRNLQNQAEAQFSREPVSATWAAATESKVDTAFAPKNLQYLQAPTPQDYSSDCRTSTCKIQIRYRDEAQAEVGRQFLLYDMGSRLQNAQWFQQVNSDGSVQLVAYAQAGAPGRAGSH